MRFLFLVLILLLPTQLGKHWWPEWSLVDGARVDYLAPTIYLTDIILLLLAISIFINHISSLRGVPTRLPRSLRSLAMTGIIYILFMIWRSPRPWLAGYWVARYLEIAVIALIVQSSKLKVKSLLAPLSAGIIFSVGLGVVQMVLGKTTGWFWWLGERNFNLAAPGAATMTILGREILRPYATFGHPNALAGFIAAATVLLLQVQSLNFKVQSLLLALMGGIGVVLTGSRGAVAALAAAMLFRIQNSEFRIKILLILGIVAGLGVLGILGNDVRFSEESVSDRLVLAGAAVDMWKENWAVGVGPGQFLARLPEYLPQGFYKIQPVHNVFLLGLAEFGIIGVSIIVITVIKIIKLAVGAKSAALKFLPVLAVIFVTGMVDHYWLTAQQNRLLLGVILGMIISPWGRLSIFYSGLRPRSK